MKKFTASILAVFLAFSGMGTIYANESYSAEMSESIQNIVLSVKKKIDVSAEFNDVNYNVYDENIDIEWKKKNSEDNESISVNADKNGEIQTYYFRSTNYEKSKIIAVSDAKQNADDFIKNVIDSYSQYSLKKSVNKTNNNYYEFYYSKFVNNIEVGFDNIYIVVNKYSGKVYTYRRTTKKANGIYPEPTGIVSKEVAINEYIKEKGIDLYYDDDDSEEIKLVTRNMVSLEIDAKTGKSVNYTDYDIELEDAGDSETMMSAATGSQEKSLSVEEVAKAEEIAGLISPEEALKKVKAVFSAVKNESLKSSSITKAKEKENETQYNMRISTENAYATLNARTGEILSFRYYSDAYNKDRTLKISFTDAEKNAKATLDSLKIRAELYDNNAERYSRAIEKNYYDFYLNYCQAKDSIRYNDNNISITIDSESGNVISYSKYWKNVQFPNVSKKPTDRELFEIISKYSNFSLRYELIKGEIKLVYAFGDYIEADALSGEKIKNSWKDDDDVKTYDDIDNHWCRDYVEYISNYGFSFDSDSFEPEKEVTWQDLIAFDKNTITNVKAMKKAKKNEKVTRYDFAEMYFSEKLGDMEDLLSKPQYFADIFNDVEEKYKPSVSFASMLGFMSSDDNGNFNGNKVVTRAEMAELIYKGLILD